MRKALALMALSGLAFAGEVFVDVPITINSTGGCQFDGLPSNINLGSFPSVSPNGYVLNPITIPVKCTQGVAYTVRVASTLHNPSNNLRLTGPSSALLEVELFRDSGFSQKITNSNRVIASDTGDGTTKTYTVYTRIAQCSSANCPVGNFSDTITFRITY